MTATSSPTSAGEQLDAIIRDLDATSAAWVAAGYGYDSPEWEAREAVFARLRAWNSARACQTSGRRPRPDLSTPPT